MNKNTFSNLEPANLRTFLRSRRSIRRFTPEPIPADLIQRILETATYAPSAHNKQPWRFCIVTDPSAKTRLAEAIGGKFRADLTRDGAPESEIQDRLARTLRRTNEAPIVILLCREVNEVRPQPDAVRQDAEAWMGRQSVAMAGLQLLLAAHAEGLSGTWICWPLFTPDETRATLELPVAWEPQGMVFIGHPAESPETPERRELNEVVRYIGP